MGAGSLYDVEGVAEVDGAHDTPHEAGAVGVAVRLRFAARSQPIEHAVSIEVVLVEELEPAVTLTAKLDIASADRIH